MIKYEHLCIFWSSYQMIKYEHLFDHLPELIDLAVRAYLELKNFFKKLI